jgi:predicted RNA binding protein YcfA (HicA-like mRNA interferase family)
MTKPITYGQLHRLLTELGFQDISVPDSHAAFRHQDTDTVILLAIHAPTEPAREIDVRRVGRILDEKGILDAGAFARFVADGRLSLSAAREGQTVAG